MAFDTLRKLQSIFNGRLINNRKIYDNNEVLLIHKISKKEYCDVSKLFEYRLKNINGIYRHQTISKKKPLKRNVLYYLEDRRYNNATKKHEKILADWYRMCYIERHDGYYEIYPFISLLGSVGGPTFIRSMTRKIFLRFFDTIGTNQKADIFHLRDVAIAMETFKKL